MTASVYGILALIFGVFDVVLGIGLAMAVSSVKKQSATNVELAKAVSGLETQMAVLNAGASQGARALIADVATDVAMYSVDLGNLRKDHNQLANQVGRLEQRVNDHHADHAALRRNGLQH